MAASFSKSCGQALPNKNRVLFLQGVPIMQESQTISSTQERRIILWAWGVNHIRLVRGFSQAQGTRNRFRHLTSSNVARRHEFPSDTFSCSCSGSPGRPHGRLLLRIIIVLSPAIEKDEQGGAKQAPITSPSRIIRLSLATCFLFD
eukprot:4001286-Pyramimonas_sp.AAC.1